MTVATLKVRPLAEMGPECRQLLLDCPHGITRGTVVGGPLSPTVTDDEVTRWLLLRHHAEQGCRCVRFLWRKAFGCPWPEVPIARSEQS